jgi:hypothetical protein
MILELMNKYEIEMRKPRLKKAKHSKYLDADGDRILLDTDELVPTDLSVIADKIADEAYSAKNKRDDTSSPDEDDDAERDKIIKSIYSVWDDNIKRRTYEKSCKKYPRGNFLSEKVSPKLMNIIERALRNKKVDDKTIDRVIRRIKSEFAIYALNELYLEELDDIKVNFPLIKSLSKSPMHFLLVFFCTFLSDKYIYKAIEFVNMDLLGNSHKVSSAAKMLYKGKDIPTHEPKKTTTHRHNLQIDICEFFDEIKEVNNNRHYNHITASMINVFSSVSKETRHLLSYIEEIAEKAEIERRLYVFFRLIIEQSLNVEPKNYRNYINMEAFRKMYDRFGIFKTSEGAARGVAKNGEFSMAIARFLEYFYKEFSYAIYHLSPLPKRRWDNSLKFDCEMDNLYEPSIEDLTEEEILEIGLRTGEIIKVSVVAPDVLEKIKTGEYNEAMSKYGMKAIPHENQYRLNETFNIMLGNEIAFENGVYRAAKMDEKNLPKLDAQNTTKTFDEEIQDYENFLIEKYFCNQHLS